MQFFRNQFGKFARLVNALASSPGATAVAFAIVILWVAAGPRFHYSEFWQLIMNTTSSIITFLMVFVLNNAQSRDTAAINAKLDTLILALEHADNRLVGLERQTDSRAKEVLAELSAAVEDADTESPPPSPGAAP